MTLQTRLSDLITAVGTDYKQLRVWLTGSSTGDLTSLTTTAKSSIIAAINEVKASASGAPPAATESTAGVAQVATQAEVNAGTIDTDMVTPLKFQTRLAAYAQPLAANLTALAAVASSTIGRTILGSADANAVKSALGLATVATSGSASDITTGTLPSSVMPPLAINDTFVVASQAAMLALTAQRGDIAKRTDQNGTPYVLSTDDPTTLANWVSLDTTSDVSSVNSYTGTVVLTKSDVGLANVDNTADSSKPVSTAQAASIATKLSIASNLSDVANAATALGNLGGLASSAVGNPDTDLVALYTTAKA